MFQTQQIAIRPLLRKIKAIDNQLFKHEFATSKCFWPKLKESKGTKSVNTNKIFSPTKIKP